MDRQTKFKIYVGVSRKLKTNVSSSSNDIQLTNAQYKAATSELGASLQIL